MSAATGYDVTVPTLAETCGDFIGPLNPHVGRFVRIHRHERGPRVYLGGCRLHHGPAFAFLAALAWRFRRHRIAAACALWAATDYKDFPFRDHNNH